MRSTNVEPLGEVCEKKLRRTMSDECESAALRSLAFSRSGFRSFNARSALVRHRMPSRIVVDVAVRQRDVDAGTLILGDGSVGGGAAGEAEGGDGRAADE